MLERFTLLSRSEPDRWSAECGGGAPPRPEISRANPRRSERIGAGFGVSNRGGHP